MEDMHGRLHHVIVDCPDPAALASFYSTLLNQPITFVSDDFAVVAANETTSGIAFQRVRNHRAPTWPDNNVPQQLHLDIMVESVADATPQVLALGATGGTTVEVQTSGEGASAALDVVSDLIENLT